MGRTRDGVLHESEELDHVTVYERNVDPLGNLVPHRTQDPVGLSRIHTRKRVVSQTAAHVVVLLGAAHQLILRKCGLSHAGYGTPARRPLGGAVL
jgi:hypothetical protein